MASPSFEIHDLLPHRYPFLFVDRIVSSQNGESVEGVFHVPEDHPFVNRACHIPVFPSFLVVEAMAQVAAVCIRAEHPVSTSKPRSMGYLVRIDQCSFDGPIHPGQNLLLKARLVANYETLFKFDAVCEISGETAARAALTLHISI